MSDAMVTARMSQAKKEAGNRALERLGTNASRAINDLYDYVISNRKLPAEMMGEQLDQRSRAERLKEAAEWFEALALPPGNRFASMSDEEIRRERLVAKGYATRGDFQ